MPKNAFSLTNLDDKNGLVMTKTRSRVYTYSLKPQRFQREKY